MKIFSAFLLSLVFVSCVQMEKAPEAETNPVVDSNENPKLIFSTNHEPINSLNYKTVTVESSDVVSIKMYGSSEKNVSIIDDGSDSFKHLVHPSDQYIKAIILKSDGKTYNLTFRIDSEEIVI